MKEDLKEIWIEVDMITALEPEQQYMITRGGAPFKVNLTRIKEVEKEVKELMWQRLLSMFNL